MFNVKKGVLVT